MNLTEDKVKRWIFQSANQIIKTYGLDEISVTEVVSECLRQSYYRRFNVKHMHPTDVLKILGTQFHMFIQPQLKAEGFDVEVPVMYNVGAYKLIGRIDALGPDNEVVEFKTASAIPKELPKHYVLQLQTYMHIVESDVGYIVVFSRVNGDVKVFKFSRNYKMFEEVLKRANIFYKHINKQIPPPREPGYYCRTCPFYQTCNRNNGHVLFERKRGEKNGRIHI